MISETPRQIWRWWCIVITLAFIGPSIQRVHFSILGSAMAARFPFGSRSPGGA
jgi:hypothetical protein